MTHGNARRTLVPRELFLKEADYLSQSNCVNHGELCSEQLLPLSNNTTGENKPHCKLQALILLLVEMLLSRPCCLRKSIQKYSSF